MEKQITKLIPAFILEKFNRKIFEGEIEAAVLYLDIAGFTSITEKLMRSGREGAERTSEILNEVFTSCIHEVYIRKGFIPHFMGDGFIAVFPRQKIEVALSSAQKIADIFYKKKDDFEVLVSYKMAISHGEVRWKILANRFKNTYFFFGTAIEKVHELESECEAGKILCSELSAKVVEKETNYGAIKSPQRSTKRKSEKIHFSNKELTSFVGEKLIISNLENEYRSVIPCFISIQKDADSDEIINQIITESNSFGGYFKDVIIEKEEIRTLIYFGSPNATEKPFTCALDFSLSLKEVFRTDIKVGISSGIMFSGFIGSRQRREFLVIGDKVNLASRLCTASQWGEILTDETIYKNAHNNYKFDAAKKLSIKGFSKKIQVFRAITRKPKQTRLEELIGREEQLKILLKAGEVFWQNGSSKIIHVVGEAGIGKSFLVDTLHRRLEMNRSGEFNWITLSCNGIVRTPYNPFIRFFREFFRQNNEFSLNKNRSNFKEALSEVINKCKDGQVSEELLRTRSCISALLGLHWENSLYQKLDAKGKQKNTVIAVISFIRAMASHKPLLLQIEDVHWIDNFSLQIFGELLRESPKRPLLVITTGRYLEDGSSFTFGVEGYLEMNIHLKVLEKRLVKELAEEKLQEKISQPLFELIWEKTNGNPFFVEQIAQYLLESALLIHKNGTVYPSETLDKGDVTIPETIHAIILARIDQLTKGLKKLVKTASVLGREFATEVLSAMLKNKNIEEMLGEGERKDIWNSLSEIVYIFKHALIRDSVYQMQLKKQLRVLHKLAAVSIESVYSKNLELCHEDLAYHYEQANVIEKALYYLEKAGLYAQKNYYNSKAIELFEHYLELSKKGESYSKKRNFIKNQLGLVYQHIGELQKAIEIFTDVIDSQKVDSEGLGFALNYLGWIHYIQRDFREALRLYERAATCFNKLDHRQGLTITYGHFAVIYLNSNKYEQAEEYFNKKLELCNRYDLKKEKYTAYVNKGVLYNKMGQYDKALKYLFKVLDESSKARNLKFKMAAYVNIGDAYHKMGEFRKAFIYFKKDLKFCQRTGDARQLSMIYEKLAKLYTHRKNYKKAYDFAFAKLQHDLKSNYKFGQQRAFQQLGIISYSRRNYDEALGFYKKELELKRKQVKIYPLSYTYFNIGLVYEKMKKYQKALEYYDKANDSLTQPHEKIRTTFIYEKALVYRKMRRYKYAREWFTKLKILAEQFKQTKYIIFALTELIHLDFIKAKTNEARQELLSEMEKLFDIAETEEEKKTITRGVRSFLRRLEKHETRE